MKMYFKPILLSGGSWVGDSSGQGGGGDFDTRSFTNFEKGEAVNIEKIVTFELQEDVQSVDEVLSPEPAAPAADEVIELDPIPMVPME